MSVVFIHYQRKTYLHIYKIISCHINSKLFFLFSNYNDKQYIIGFNRMSGQNDTVQMTFMEKWLTSHWEDSRTILKKPLVFTEFGKSSKYPGYNTNARDSFMSVVYSSIYNLAQNGGTFAGGLVWQLLDEGMEGYDDGYAIVLSQNPSTCTIISQ